jgi:hypothetical protein
MRSLCLNTILAACLLGGAAVEGRADMLTRVEIDVPFPFQVGSVPMPAGRYEVFQPHDTGAVIIGATEGSGAIATIVAPFAEGAGSKASFVHVDGKYFLSSISLGDGRMVQVAPRRK